MVGRFGFGFGFGFEVGFEVGFAGRRFGQRRVPLALPRFDGGTDRRGYQFHGARLRNGWRVLAGCRNFSPDEALAHWRNNPECLALANEVIEAVEQKG